MKVKLELIARKSRVTLLASILSLGKKFLHDESGQAITEYILLLSVCVFGASALGRGILKSLDAGILKLGGQLEKDLKSGRQALSVWKN